MEAERIRIEAEKALHQSGVRKYFSYRAERGALTWEEDVEAVEQRKREAGKYALRVKTELPAEDVVRAYRTLLACEDAFRVLKDELDLRPLWHQCDVNVEGHVLLAMWSYLLYKTLEVKLEQSRVETTAARALQAVKEVKAVEVTLRERPVWKLMKVSKEAEQVFAAIGIEDLKGRFHQWAKDAPPFHYQPRLYPYPKPEA
jgi:transposase